MQVRLPGLSESQRQQRSPNGLISLAEQLRHKALPSSPQARQSGGDNNPIVASSKLIYVSIIRDVPPVVNVKHFGLDASCCNSSVVNVGCNSLHS